MTKPPDIVVNGERWTAVLRDKDGRWLYAIPGSCLLTTKDHLARRGGRYKDGEQ